MIARNITLPQLKSLRRTQKGNGRGKEAGVPTTPRIHAVCESDRYEGYQRKGVPIIIYGVYIITHLPAKVRRWWKMKSTVIFPYHGIVMCTKNRFLKCSLSLAVISDLHFDSSITNSSASSSHPSSDFWGHTVNIYFFSPWLLVVEHQEILVIWKLQLCHWLLLRIVSSKWFSRL